MAVEEVEQRRTDIKLFVNPDDLIYDFRIGSDGDIETLGGLQTAITMSFFAQRRADETQQPVNFLRRGWWGNETNEVEGFEIGSKIWLLQQARNLADAANAAEDFTREAYQWMIEDGFFNKIETVAINIENGIQLSIRFENDGDIVETTSFQILQDTIIELETDD